MSEPKTVPTDRDVEEFLNSVENEQRRKDSFKMLEFMKRVTGEEPVMWGPSIVGFGKYHYKYASGHEGDSMLTGFSPRKQSLTVYIMSGFSPFQDIMHKLGKHKASKSCLYIKKLEDVDMSVLERIVRQSIKHTQALYGK